MCRFLRPFYCPYLSQSWDSNSYILLYRYFEPSWTLILHDFLMFSILWLFYRYHLTSTPWPIVDMQYFAIAFCQCIHEPTVYICFWHMFFDQKKMKKHTTGPNHWHFVWRIHRQLVVFSYKGTVLRKSFPLNDAIMLWPLTTCPSFLFRKINRKCAPLEKTRKVVLSQVICRNSAPYETNAAALWKPWKHTKVCTSFHQTSMNKLRLSFKL